MALVTGVQTDSEIRGLRQHYPLITRGKDTASSVNRALNVSGANATYTAASLVTAGAIIRDCGGAPKTDTLPDADDIIAAFRLQEGDSVSFLIFADDGELTIDEGADTTIQGRAFIPSGSPGEIRLAVTGGKLLGAISDPTLDAAARQQFFSLLPTGETEIDTADDVTYSAADVQPGLILRDPASADRADELPLATDTITGLRLAFDGASRVVYIAAAGANSVTVAAQSGDTDTGLAGSGVIAAGATGAFLVTRIASDAVRWLRV